MPRSALNYADTPRRSNRNATGRADRRGIIRTSALWILCRCRHNAHWTGSEKRLERIKKFANREAYAFEELVAEIGACFLGAQIGVAPEFDQSAAYVEGWLKALKEEKRAIFRAASEAQKAADFVLAAAGQSKAAAA
ncbi:zincin-like metallopeptidase domain-containing protein [Aliiroseovarius sp.]|uniref:zincin-like metallopeptidase domain-containing protein n=1 Tax=Aliiroseovarius sp. TaxID=1872442 RepID=UPI003BAB448C